MTQPLQSISLLVVVTFISLPIGNARATAVDPSLNWIAGHWCVDLGGDTAEELWLPPHGGVAVGLGRTRNSEKTIGFEYLRIFDLNGVQSFIAQPGGKPPIAFKRTARGENWVRFENPDHDFPQRIEHRREGDA